MKTLIIFEKLHQQKHLLNHYPFPVNESLVVGYVLPYTVFPFKYPNNLRYRDLPFTQTPEYRLNLTNPYIQDGKAKLYRTIRFFEMDKQLKPIYEIEHNTIANDVLRREFLAAFDLIIVANDPDRSGEMAARLFLSKSGVEFSDSRLLRMILMAYDKASCEKAWASLKPFNNDFSLKIYNYGLAKHYFDFNFNMMSNIVFGDLLSAVGVENPVATFTKYQLMVMHILHNANRHLKTESLWRLMNYYKGSGKHQTAEIGSPSTRQQIIKHLLQMELVSGDLKTWSHVQLTSLGKDFCSKLHKKTFDPDLPQRIENWGVDFNDTKRAQIDTYLRTLFGKQMRFQKPLLSSR